MIEIIPNWKPHDLLHCLDGVDNALGYLLASVDWWSSLVIVILYVAIAIVWWQSMKKSSQLSKIFFGSLIIIFIFCDIGGYFSRVMSWWQPQIAYLMRGGSMWINAVACIVFLVISQWLNFKDVGANELLGSEIINEHPAILKLTYSQKLELLTEISKTVKAFLTEKGIKE